FFPSGVIHVVVVDPGVGSERALLYAEVGGQRLLVPDNGCWTSLIRPSSPLPLVRQLAEPQYWRPAVSTTFHGRDILAPVAGWLSRGLDPQCLGPVVAHWVDLPLPIPDWGPKEIKGEVLFVDDFGNLLTNIPGEALAAWTERPLRVTVGKE